MNSSGSSTSAFVSSLVFNGLVFCAFITGFILLRKKYKRVYEPRSMVSTIASDKAPESPPAGGMSWLPVLLHMRNQDIIDKCGLDAYFFLRYMRMMMFIFLGGIVLTWPILLPVNATGGGGQTGLDMLSFSNVQGTKRFYAQVFVTWIFLAYILWYFTWELNNFVATRHTWLLRPEISMTRWAKTLLVQSIPMDMLTVDRLTEIFGPAVERVYINRDFDDLQNMIDERTKNATKLEAGETKLIKQSVKSANKNGVKEVPEDQPIWKSYLPEKKRPSHRLKFLIGKKVDTIDYTREQLHTLNQKIKEAQKSHEEYKNLPSAFITFTSQYEAHRAAQISLRKEVGLNSWKCKRFLAIQPGEVTWKNTNLQWQRRSGQRIIALTVVVLLIIFWTVPVAVVGSISNINYLTNEVPFLSFILKCPPVILGLITGLLPSVLLSILMALLPIMLRFLARFGGEPSKSFIELEVQNMYFGFQVVQVFLVTTLASAASSVASQIFANPATAESLLSTNLPKASNFYISYLLLQGLTIAGGAFLRIVPLILYFVLGPILDSTPRKKWRRWNILGGLGWGTVFPIYTNLAVIGITYSTIAPLILAFAALMSLLIYLAYLYGLMYVYNCDIDTTGLVFPRAIWQSFTGIYLLEICLTGLFGTRASTPHIVLMAITIPVTAIYQIYLQRRLCKRIFYLPLEMGSPSEVGESGGHQRAISEETRTDDQTHAGKAQESVPEGMVDTSDAYHHPAVTNKEPWIWIPHDALGISTQEIAACKEIGHIEITDRGAGIDEKAKLTFPNEYPPDYEP